MTRQRKTRAELVAEALAFMKSAHPEPVEGRTPNQRQFGINDPEAWELFRPPPNMLPAFPPSFQNPVERDEK